MYELTVEQEFEAAHKLPAAGGACEELHGHTYKAAITVEADALDETGVALDFRTLKSILSDVIRPLDHSFLNEVPPFDRLPPSAENIARYVFEGARDRLAQAAPGVSLQSATVWESDTTSASYTAP